jgi:hypothetical protein
MGRRPGGLCGGDGRPRGGAEIRLFARYSFRAIPVVGDGNIMKGAIPYRDIMNLSCSS